ncbi:hypothetical protein SAMN05443292_0781 [Halpernia frigidisoli]|uniref:Uncharacterized protein n=1 Tax=Halpernia frigidisoli TaxID=1125876 RepID=A0A1I3DZ00_9FLAO|nr:hypothetical protein SAMN05443292_0781 [Halpernia frigidisoli]
MYKYCGACYDCSDYIYLIKKDNDFFSLSTDSRSNDLTDKKFKELNPYLEILNFFKKFE